jgi:hypothetical protein
MWENGRFVGHGVAELVERRATQVFSDSSCLGWSEAQTGMPLGKIIGATAASNTL